MKNCGALKNYLPSFLSENKVLNDIFLAIGNDFDKYDYEIEDVFLQMFPQTATWGLKFWEDFCGIITNENIDLELRRLNVLTKFFTHLVTWKRVRDLARSYTKDDSLEIIEYFDKYTFAIKYKIDSNEDNLKEIIEENKPAHLAYFFILASILKNNEEKFEVRSLNRFFLNFRGNIPLVLDGSWFLNGEYFLSGYKNYSKDPIGIKTKNIFNIRTAEHLASTISFLIEKNLKTKELFSSIFLVNGFPIRFRSMLTVKNKVNFKIKQSERFTANTLTIERGLWYIDGKYNLNGRKLLNSEIIKEEF